MPRDYAHTPRSTRQTTSRSSGLPGWVWLLAGLSIGLAVAAMVYISRPLAAAPAAAGATDTSIPAKGGKSPAAKPGQPLPLPPKEKPRFTFYELLPSQEMVVPRDDTAPRGGAKPPAAPSTPGELYYIQVASYRALDDAEKQKANLALLGAEARIEKVTIDNKDTYYRVRIGPEKDLTHAQALVARLDDNGIQAMLVKLKN